ncbi:MULTISPECIES: 5-formyltetrahydrofolate cyclo-ligase [unclassified Leucobacter]|uniref:5-formyltetrahydrofolate cyclo-ligase n=1 Tax=unclassified Leucobacter TaxID=2621730 RepID=UPI00165DCFDC|nr:MULTISPECIES: 5-formyltetrahydrofolate cyclo-ligase [unclassified Leucobacter]MBC9928497.1 5-formyltetrahydrofolate cyclo-ligase [Leucobacter sp. cx-169]MBC9936693.1 5-formyltetrahydrofolate cyclo-ligase [Leucobacter sp. cx-87]
MADDIDRTEITRAKRMVRTEVRQRRAELSEAARTAARDGITANLRTLVTGRGASSVSCYLAIAGEPDTSGFLEWAATQGVRVLLPIAREDGLLEWAVAGDGDIHEGLYGLPEPGGEILSPLAVNDVDLMIIPACSIDETGDRIGWGRGYFDKSLGSMDRRPPVFAVVYDSEFVPEVPTELHDVPVTGVVTESQVHYFKTSH